MNQYGEIIRRFREERGLTQLKLAYLSGVNPATINLIEHGKRNASAGTLEKIAGALDVEIADLFPKDQAPLPFEHSPKGKRLNRTARSHAGRMTGSARVEVTRKVTRILADAGLEGKVLEDAREKLLDLVGAV